MKKVDFEFTTSGESPDFGAFNAGDTRPLDEAVAEVLKDRGMGKIVEAKTEKQIRKGRSAEG